MHAIGVWHGILTSSSKYFNANSIIAKSLCAAARPQGWDAAVKVEHKSFQLMHLWPNFKMNYIHCASWRFSVMSFVNLSWVLYSNYYMLLDLNTFQSNTRLLLCGQIIFCFKKINPPTAPPYLPSLILLTFLPLPALLPTSAPPPTFSSFSAHSYSISAAFWLCIHFWNQKDPHPQVWEKRRGPEVWSAGGSPPSLQNTFSH